MWFGMDKKSSALGAKPKVGWFPIEVSRRQDGGFLPYPEGTRCILLLNVSKRPCGDHSTAVVSPVQQQNTLAPNHKLIRHYSLGRRPRV
ncbi:hypothetical protein ELZ20_07110 [Brucella abortus]|nr:hypothetical protein ELZ23_05475 [Brucella abortus]RUQ93787.1 hypothetical protein ELZ20_07110 [Brucella abortus]RUR00426.1 hypothetical protein ELZ21_05460 [Brucella abortus]